MQYSDINTSKRRILKESFTNVNGLNDDSSFGLVRDITSYVSNNTVKRRFNGP